MNERAAALSAALGALTDADERRVRRLGVQIGHRLSAGGVLYAFGNGGSAAEADHFVGEIMGAYEDNKRECARAVNLSAQPATHTSQANDFGYEAWPARFVVSERGLRRQDVLFLLTTSGESKNVLAALWAREKRFAPAGPGTEDPIIVILTGAKYRRSALKKYERPEDYVFVVESESTSRVQEISLFLLHEIARAVEESLAVAPD